MNNGREAEVRIDNITIPLLVLAVGAGFVIAKSVEQSPADAQSFDNIGRYQGLSINPSMVAVVDSVDGSVHYCGLNGPICD